VLGMSSCCSRRWCRVLRRTMLLILVRASEASPCPKDTLNVERRPCLLDRRSITRAEEVGTNEPRASLVPTSEASPCPNDTLHIEALVAPTVLAPRSGLLCEPSLRGERLLTGEADYPRSGRAELARPEIFLVLTQSDNFLLRAKREKLLLRAKRGN